MAPKPTFLWQLRIFSCMFIGYMFFYVTRKSFSAITPAFLMDETIGVSKQTVGSIGSAMSLSYSIGKLLSSISSDLLPPSSLLPTLLIACALCNALFSMSASTWQFTLLWTLNGLVQAGGWAPCVKLLTAWYPKQRRGTWWAAVATSQSAGAALAGLLGPSIASLYSWRLAMQLGSVVSFIAAIYCAIFLYNSSTPQQRGFAPVDDIVTKVKKKKEVPQTIESPVALVLKNPLVWLLSFAFFFLYIIRAGITDWYIVYLVECKGMKIVDAGKCIFWFEIGGAFGATAAGIFSDFVAGGRRAVTNLSFMCGVLLFTYPLYGFLELPTGVCTFIYGVFLYGPQMLIGVHLAEVTDKRAVGTAQGFSGILAGLGAMVAGYPASFLVAYGDNGWRYFFHLLVAAAAATILCIIPVWFVHDETPTIHKRIQKQIKVKVN